MSYMFYGCSSLKEINISNFNTNNATDMSGMFYGCSSLKEINILNLILIMLLIWVICSLDAHH